MTPPNDPAADLARDLRAPLDAVAGHVHALDDGTLGPLAPGQQRAVKQVLDGVTRMHLLLAERLAAADPPSAPGPQAFDYDDVIRQTLEAFEPLADAKGLTLARRTALRELVAVDLGWVSHLLARSLHDAARLAPDGATLTVRAAAREGRLVTEVHVDGLGEAPAFAFTLPLARA